MRPEKTEAAQWFARPAYMSDHIWQANDGESFMLECPDAIATHMVASYYRIWAGELPVDEQAREELSEEELLQLLMDSHAEEDSHENV